MIKITRDSRGFTIIEIVVVLAVSIMLTTIFIGFSKRNDRIIALGSEQLKLINGFVEAKSLALQTLIQDISAQRVCGYGIHIVSDLHSYTLFRDLPNPKTGDCIAGITYTGNRVYDESDVDELVATSILASGLQFQSIPTSDIFFLPPDPRTFFTPDPGGNSVTFILETDDAAASRGVKITKAGQISAE